jgi:predicted nucleic acid-binding protein
VLYLDSSAILKLVFREAESDALRAFIEFDLDLVTSRLGWTEVRRQARRSDPNSTDSALVVLRRFDLVPVDVSILDSASFLTPPTLRTLDAIHVATALSIRDDLEGLVTYDRRTIEAATLNGLSVESPGMATA